MFYSYLYTKKIKSNSDNVRSPHTKKKDDLRDTLQEMQVRGLEEGGRGRGEGTE